LSTLVLIPFALAKLGPVTYGDWAILWQVIGYVGFLDLGVAYAASRDIAAARGRGRASDTDQLVASGFWLYAVLGVVFLLVGLALLPVLSGLIGGLSSVDAPWLMLLAFGATAFPTRFLGAANQAAQRIATSNLIGLVQGLTNLVLSLIFLQLGFGLIGLALGILLSGVVALALQAILFARVYGLATLAPRLVRKDRLKDLIGFSLQVFVTGVGWMIVASTDILVVGAVLGSVAVTFFVVNYRIPSQVVSFLNLGADVSLPRLAELSGDSTGSATAAGRLSALVGLASGTCAAGVAVFLRPFVAVWVGSAYAPSTLLLVLVSYLVVHHPVQHVLATFLAAARRMGTFAVISISEAALNVVLSVALTIRLGVAGTLLGTAVAGLLNIAYSSIKVSEHVGRSPLSTLRRLYSPALTCASIGLAVGLPLVHLLQPSTWTVLIAAGVVWTLLVALLLATVDRLVMKSQYRSLVADLIRATITGSRWAGRA
jgi:O-antigen/teichoic acid export membrane protein